MADGNPFSSGGGGGGGGNNGNPFATGGGTALPPPPPKKKKGGGGWGGWLQKHVQQPLFEADKLLYSWPGMLLEQHGPKSLQGAARVAQALETSPVFAARYPGATTRDVGASIRGGAELAYLVGKARVWRDPGAQKQLDKVVRGMPKAIIADYKKRYGKNWQEEAAKHPFANLSDALIVGGAAARGAALAGAAARLAKIGELRSASDLWKEAARPGLISEGEARPRVTEYHPPGAEEPRRLVQPYSGSPTRRYTQEAIQTISHELPKLPVLGARSRVLRGMAHQMPRVMDRMLASVVGAEHLDSLPEAGRSRLFWAENIGDHSTEALQRLRVALKDEYSTEVPEGDASFQDWLRQAKQAGFGDVLLKRLDKAIKYKPDETYWKAHDALVQATQVVEHLQADHNGFSNLTNDLKRAQTRLDGLTDPNSLHPADPEVVTQAEEEVASLQEQLDGKEQSLVSMFNDRRGRPREWFDANSHVDTEERTARLQDWSDVSKYPDLGPEKAAAAVADIDKMANASGDPAEFWRTRVGFPSNEPPQQVMARAGNLLFQSHAGEQGLVQGDLSFEGTLERGGSVYYSGLQNWLEKQNWVETDAQQLERTLEKAATIKPREFYNANLRLFFDQHRGEAKISKQDLLNHLATPLNAYNLRERYLVEDIALSPTDRTKWGKLTTGESFVSREAANGEYREIIAYLPKGGKARNILHRKTLLARGLTTFSHWKPTDNVVFHIRLHVFTENGVKKVLVEEVQSDWAAAWRKQGLKEHEVPGQGTPEEAARLAEVEAMQPQMQKLWDDIHTTEDHYYEVLHEHGADAAAPVHERLLALEDEQRALEEKQMTLGPYAQPSPLGPNYHQTAIRRVMREAAEEDAHEVIFVDPRVQHARNWEFGHPAMDVLGQGRDARFAPLQGVLDWYAQNPGNLETSVWPRLYGKDYPGFVQKEFGLQGEHVPDAYVGRFSNQHGQVSGSGAMPGTRFRLTPEAKAQALRPQALYQKPPEWGAIPKGATELLANGDRLIHTFRTADVSTIMHELFHSAVYDLKGEHRKALEDYYGGGASIDVWKETQHENAARDWEMFRREGVAPNAQLQRIFTQIATWMQQIYKQVDKRYADVPQDVKDAFASMYVNRSDTPEVFMPHRPMPPNLTGARTSRGIPRASREIGDQAKSRIPLYKHNRLALLRSGLLSDDPRHLFEHLNRVMMLARANQLRELVLEMGKPLLPGESPDFKGDFGPAQYVVKRTGRGVDKPMFDALENADDPAQIATTIKDYIDSHITDTEKWKEWQGEGQLYTVDKKTVDMLFKNVTGKKPGATTGPKSAGGKVFDALLDSTRGLLLYGNPGFYVANMAGNAWMTAVSDPRAFRYLPWSMKNALAKAGRTPGGLPQGEVDPFWQQVSTEMGRGATAGQLSSEQGFIGKRLQTKGGRLPGLVEAGGTELPRWWGARAGAVVDDSFRVGAWRQAARKHGYRTKEQQQKLLDDAVAQQGTKWYQPNSKAARDLNAIRDEAENLMLDFDSMTPFEKTYLMRAIFLYPFLRASTKYPAMFAGERPIVAGLLGAAGMQGSQAANRAYGPRPDLPDWAQGYARFGPGSYLNIGSVAPEAPALGIAESLLALGSPAPIGINRPASYINPAIQILLEGARGQNKYGRDATWGQILKQELPVPGYITQALGLRQPSALYSDPSLQAAMLRSLRLVPFGMGAQSGPAPAPVVSSGGNGNPFAR